MAAGKDPHGDDRIEELLSKLQGIFTKLSRPSEKDPSESLSPTPQTTPETPKTPEPSIKPSSPMPAAPKPTIPTPSVSRPPNSPLLNPLSIVALPIPSASDPSEAPPASELPMIYIAIAHPAGRDAEVKILSERLETMTPKFTKVAFHLRVRCLMSADPKLDWDETVFTDLKANDQVQAIFLLSERAHEEARHKLLATELDKQGIYFQVVPHTSVEKKAFYTDALLGLIFFFDAKKPSAPTD